MAVTSKDIPDRAAPRWVRLPPLAGGIAYLVTGVLALLAAYVLGSAIVGWTQVRLDDLRYGRPRTFQLSANVGRPEEANAPTHLIAMNLDRQVVVLEIPGGDASKTRSLPAPYLFGANEELTPVTMRLADVNGDGAADLIVRVKDEEMVYINRDGAFNLITAEERAKLIQAGQ